MNEKKLTMEFRKKIRQNQIITMGKLEICHSWRGMDRKENVLKSDVDVGESANMATRA